MDAKYLSLIQRRGFFEWRLLAHCHSARKMAVSTLAKVCPLATCWWYCVHPRMIGLRIAMSSPAGICLLALMIVRTLVRKILTFFDDGLMRSLRLYLRTVCP